MMMFCVRDSKTEAYMPPFLAQNVVTAQRMLVDVMEGNNSMLASHPEDFQLFHVGTFSEDTGEITPVVHSSHGKIIDLKGEQ